MDDPSNVAPTQRRPASTASVGRAGIGFGCALAICISWSVNKSIVWAIIQGCCGWFYVIYYALKNNPP